MTAVQPGYHVTLFRSRLRPEAEQEYLVLAAEIADLARRMPGFVSLTRYDGEDGERMTVVVFESAQTQRAWREHPRHQEAQRIGRDRFYAEYSIAVSECASSYGWTRPSP